MSQGNAGETVPGPANRRRGLAAQGEVWGEVLKLAAAVETMLYQAVQVLCKGQAELAAARGDSDAPDLAASALRFAEAGGYLLIAPRLRELCAST